MFWRRSDRETIEAPAEFVWPVREERDDDEVILNSARIVSISWYGPFSRSEVVNGATDVAGQPLVYVVTGATAESPTEIVQRVGFTSAGDTTYIRGRTSGMARVWVGAVGNFDRLESLSNETFTAGDQDAKSETEFHPNLALLRRIFSYLLRPSISVYASPTSVTAPIKIQNDWNTKPIGKDTFGIFGIYCPETINLFKNGKVRLSWSSQSGFFAWTARAPQQSSLPPSPNAPDTSSSSERSYGRILLVAFLVLAVLVGLWLLRKPLIQELNGKADPQLAALLNDAQQSVVSLTSDLQRKIAEASQLRTELGAALSRIAGLEQENAELKDMLEEKATRSPLEMDSCWSRAGQRTVPVYTVAILDDGFVVDPAFVGGTWPAEFSARMTSFAEAPVAAQTRMSHSEFSTAMTPYYNFGQQPQVNCRFFVDVTDGTTNKDSWKNGLAMVERYFYKRLVP